MNLGYIHYATAKILKNIQMALFFLEKNASNIEIV